MSTPFADHRPPLPDLRRLLRRDWPALGLLAFAGLCWLCVASAWMLAALRPPGGADDRHWLVVLSAAGVSTGAIAAMVSTARLLRLRQLFQNGECVSGRVVHIGQNSEDIAFAIVEYTFQGSAHRVTTVVESLPESRRPAAGDAVNVVVDPRRPSRAALPLLFDA